MLANRYISKIVIFISLFLFIYTPPLLFFNTIHILAFFTYFFIFTKYKRLFLNFVLNKCIIIPLIIGFFSILLLFTTILFTTQNFYSLYSILVIYFEVIPISILLVLVLRSKNYSFINILSLLVKAAILQSFIAILMYFNSSFKHFIIVNFNSYFFDSDNLTYWLRFRVYGLSQSPLFGFAVVQAIIASISLYLGINHKLRYLFYIPIILFSIVINARIGLVIFLVSSIIVLLLNFRFLEFKKIIKLSISLGLLILFSVLLFRFISISSPNLYSWLREGYFEVLNFFSGDTQGYFKALKDMTFLPTSGNFLTGTGADLFNEALGSNSDIGYINDIFLGGIFFTIFMYGSILALVFNSDYKHKFILAFSAISISTLLISNVKGYSFRHNEFLSLILFIAFLIKIYKKDKMCGGEICRF